MIRLAVVGKDVSKSKSPEMHAFILNKLGFSCAYEKISIPPEKFHERAEELFVYDGFNVTIPYKGEILPYLTKLCGEAATFGAVNTVLSATREGFNTDGYGFMLMLRNAGIDVKGRRVLVLGAGGAGRSCIHTLAEAGAEVYAYGRRFETVQRVHEAFPRFTALSEIPMAPFDLIINCTGIGMHETVGMAPTLRFAGRGELPLDEAFLSRCGGAVDLIYEPAESEFLRLARSLNKFTLNGEAMLFYQAYYADCIYTGTAPDADLARGLYQTYREEI